MKICLAGTGAMGVVHVKALKKLDDVEVVSVNSRETERMWRTCRMSCDAW